MEEIVALQELVGELGERHTLLKLAVEAALDAVLGHHVVDCDALADVAGEIEEGEVLHPVVVIDQFCGVGRITVEVEEARELLAYAGDVVTQRGFVEQVALLALARGVADHAGGSAQQGDGLVAATLQVAQHHHAAQVADM